MLGAVDGGGLSGCLMLGRGGQWRGKGEGGRRSWVGEVGVGGVLAEG